MTSYVGVPGLPDIIAIPFQISFRSGMILLLNKKLDKLKLYPSRFPQDSAEKSKGKYPIEWNEMLGRIFHKICYKYNNKLINTLPTSIFKNYR